MCTSSFVVTRDRCHSSSAFSTVQRAFDYIYKELNLHTTSDTFAGRKHTDRLTALLNHGVVHLEGYRVQVFQDQPAHHINSVIKQRVV